jgi:hypothetical protein
LQHFTHFLRICAHVDKRHPFTFSQHIFGEAVVPAPHAERSIVVSKLMSCFDQSLSHLDIGVNPILN